MGGRRLPSHRSGQQPTGTKDTTGDKENQQVLYATPSELTAAPAASQGGGDVWLKDGKVYLSISYIKKYTEIDSYIYQDPDRIAIQYQFSDVNMAEVKKDTVFVTGRDQVRSN